MKKGRPYKYSSKNRLTPNSQSFPSKVSSIKKEVVTNLENTLTKLRIIDDTQGKKEILDDAFLEGRVDRKKEKKKQKKKTISLVQKERVVSLLTHLRKIVLSISAVGALLVVLMLCYKLYGNIRSHYNKTAHNSFITDSKNQSSSIDDNYLFVGDFHTQKFAFEKYQLDYHYVKNSSSTLTTTELLGSMKNMIYDFNPSIIFLEVGIMDLNDDVSQETFIDNYRRILDQISMNRPNAVIYVESIYPIDSELDNDDYFQQEIHNDQIIKYNEALKVLADEKKVKYLDFYSNLSKDNTLNPKYTDDGVSLNSKGYKVIYQDIKSIINH